MAAMSQYGWANAEAAAAGKVTIPMDAAMQKVIKDYAGNARAEAGKP
jgi:hypothetical protein